MWKMKFIKSMKYTESKPMLIYNQVMVVESVTLTLYSNNYGTKETGRFRAGMSQSLNNIAR